MPLIKIRTTADGAWLPVPLLEGERTGWVEVESEGAALWVKIEDVHPADQVMLLYERQARERYRWVPPEDLDQPG